MKLKMLSDIKLTGSLIMGCFLVLSACKQQQKIQPQRKEIIDAVFGSGHIENRDQYTVMANADGYLKAAYVAEGDEIKAGQQLFSLTNEVQHAQVNNALVNLNYAKTNTSPGAPQLQQLKIQIAQAADKARVDSLNYARYTRLVKTQAVSQSDFDNARLQYQSSVSSLQVLQKNLADLQKKVALNLENARSQYHIQQENNNYYRINGRATGVVLSISKKPGDYVKKGDAIAQIGAGQTICKIYIAEDDINKVKVGQLALISLNSIKDKVFKAHIAKIYPSFDQNQQAFTAEATFEDMPGEALNGTQLQANIIIRKKENALVIPSYYLMDGDYVMLKGNKDKVPVKVGIRTMEWTEILSGINESDQLIAPNQQ